MHVYDTVQIAQEVGYMVHDYLQDAPDEVRVAHEQVITLAAHAWHRKHGSDIYIALDGSWPCGLARDDIDRRTCARLLRGAASSHEVLETIETRLKNLLRAEGHVLAEEDEDE